MQLGELMGKQLTAPALLCFFGDLGTGKTALIKGITAGAAGVDPGEVTSPTFVYLHIYEGHQPVYHFDLYRIPDSKKFLEMGFDEALADPAICCVEWAERIADILPEERIEIWMETSGENERIIDIRNGSFDIPDDFADSEGEQP